MIGFRLRPLSVGKCVHALWNVFMYISSTTRCGSVLLIVLMIADAQLTVCCSRTSFGRVSVTEAEAQFNQKPTVPINGMF